MALEMAPLFGVRLGNVLFPVDSSMNAAWRKGLLAVADKRLALLNYMADPRTDESYPLSTLATAELLRAAGADLESSFYALTGPRQCSADGFRDECQELVTGKGFASDVLLTTAATMRRLDADDIEALCQFLVEFDLLDQAQAALLEFAALRAHAEESREKAAADALDALWRAGLSSWVERRFNDLAKKPGEPDQD